jgi:hypothetical protein
MQLGEGYGTAYIVVGDADDGFKMSYLHKGGATIARLVTRNHMVCNPFAEPPISQFPFRVF